MKLYRYLVLILLAVAPAAFAQDYQPVPVTVSRSIVSIDGRSYYSHIVLERQTIFGITKAYEVTEEDLYAANPKLKEEGLKSGTVIYIPVSPEKAQELAVPVAESKPETKPEAKQDKKQDKKQAASSHEGYIEHTVKWFEDINDVAAAYGVTPQQIIDANGLKSSRISKRQVLLIPKPGTVVKPTEESKPAGPVTVAETGHPDTGAVTPAQPETPVEAKTGKQDADDQTGILDWLTGRGTAEFALILPFNASGKPSETNMDFYSGVLMALRDLESEGVKTKIHVYDYQAGLPSAAELGKNDFILGPVSTQELTAVLDRTGGETPVISPLDQRAATLAQTRGGFIQAPSSTANQYADLAAWAASDAGKQDKIILVTEKVNGGTAPATGVREALLNQGVTFEGVSWTQAEGRSLPSALTARLTKGGVNRIIVASEKEGFVGDMVRNLGILQGKGYQIAMYAPSRVRTFETVDGSAYHQSELHISSPYFADYETEKVRNFVRAYRALYRTEPTQFAFQGYDLAYFFAGLSAKYGNRWTRALDRVTGAGLHTDFRFEKTRDGSFRNTGIRRIIYNTDYSTELVR